MQFLPNIKNFLYPILFNANYFLLKKKNKKKKKKTKK